VKPSALGVLLAVYAAASLVHFAHNAEYLPFYPNLPPSWSRPEVYLAWCAVTVLGILGYLLYRRGRLQAGLVLLGLYALLGFAGLLHYTRAPMSHHSVGMNLSIWIEVAAAAALLIHVIALSQRRSA
jgi:hypothetical protein